MHAHSVTLSSTACARANRSRSSLSCTVFISGKKLVKNKHVQKGDPIDGETELAHDACMAVTRQLAHCSLVSEVTESRKPEHPSACICMDPMDGTQAEEKRISDSDPLLAVASN